MAGSIDSGFSKPERRSWGEVIFGLLEFSDAPLLIVVGMLVVIVLIAVVSAAFGAWTNSSSKLLD